MIRRVLASVAIAGLTSCAEPTLCDTAEATFVVERQSSVLLVATLRTRGRHDGEASYEGSWTFSAEPVESIAAVAVVGETTGLNGLDGFSGHLSVDARDDESVANIRIQRLDNADIVLEGQVSAEAEAPEGCSIDVDVIPE